MFEQHDVRRVQMRTHDLPSRRIDQIPIIDLTCVREIRPMNLLSSRVIPALVSLYHQKECDQPLFVPRRSQQVECGCVIELSVFAHKLSHDWHRETKKPVSFGVLTRPGLEEALGVNRANRIPQFVQVGADCRQAQGRTPRRRFRDLSSSFFLAVTRQCHRGDAGPFTIARATACWRAVRSGKCPRASAPMFWRFVRSTTDNLYAGTPNTYVPVKPVCEKLPAGR